VKPTRKGVERSPTGVRAFESVEMPTIADLERSVVVHAKLSLPRLGRAAGNGRAFAVLAHESELARSYARLSERRWDLVLGYPWEQDEKVEYDLPGLDGEEAARGAKAGDALWGLRAGRRARGWKVRGERPPHRDAEPHRAHPVCGLPSLLARRRRGALARNRDRPVRRCALFLSLATAARPRRIFCRRRILGSRRLRERWLCTTRLAIPKRGKNGWRSWSRASRARDRRR